MARSKSVTKESVYIAVKKYQALLGMQDWTIEVSFVPSPDAHGDCRAYPPHKKATISVNLDTQTKPVDMEATVRHEMFHAMMWQFTQVSRQLAGDKGKRAVLRDLEETLVTQMENWPLWKAVGP